MRGGASFPLIRHGFAVPPSPARGEGLSLRLSRLLCNGASASVGAFPLMSGISNFTNHSLNLKVEVV